MIIVNFLILVLQFTFLGYTGDFTNSQALFAYWIGIFDFEPRSRENFYHPVVKSTYQDQEFSMNKISKKKNHNVCKYNLRAD